MTTSQERPNPKTLLPILLLASLALLLSACAGGSLIQASSWPGLTLIDETLYVAYNQSLRAIDATSGAEQWRFPAEAERGLTFYAPPALTEDGLVIAGGFDNVVYALRPAGSSAQVAWTFEGSSDRIIGGPVVTGSTVLVPSADGRLYALDVQMGEPVWSEAQTAGHALWSAPLVEDSRVHLASLDHNLYTLDLESGREIWRQDLSGAITDTPTLIDGTLLAGTYSGTLAALDAQQGKVLWTFEADAGIWGNPAIAGQTAYFADVAGNAYAVDVKSGAEVWRADIEGASSASPAIVGERVYFVTEAGAMFAFDIASGESVWPAPSQLPGRLLADPITKEGDLFVAALESDCLVYTVNADTGASRCLLPLE